MNTDCISSYVGSHLSEKRKIHTLGVRDTAVHLAGKYGADPAKAEIAALVHDLFRGKPIDLLNAYVDELGLDPARYRDNANLSHGKIAAALIQTELEVHDPDIINAVSFHTTGRPGMSQLEKVIFLADAIEPSRDYPGVDELRRLAETDLDRACLRSLSRTADYVQSQGKWLDPDTRDAIDYFERIIIHE